MTISTDRGTLLLVGASRGLGHALAAEFVKKGWLFGMISANVP